MSKQIKKCAYYDYMLCKTFLHTLVFEDASSPLFLTYCRIDIFRVLRQSFCGKFQIVCGFWNPANPAFRMYDQKGDEGRVKDKSGLVMEIDNDTIENWQIQIIKQIINFFV